jgi:hypothetical protein
MPILANVLIECQRGEIAINRDDLQVDVRSRGRESCKRRHGYRQCEKTVETSIPG